MQPKPRGRHSSRQTDIQPPSGHAEPDFTLLRTPIGEILASFSIGTPGKFRFRQGTRHVAVAVGPV
jgi:hypothetical protein